MKALFALTLIFAFALPADACPQSGQGLGFHPFAGLRHHAASRSRTRT